MRPSGSARLARHAPAVLASLALMLVVLASGTVRAEGPTDGPAVDATTALQLLDRVTSDPWQVDRALILPDTTAASDRAGHASPFRVTVEAAGSTHASVAFPTSAPQSEATPLGLTASISGAGSICRIPAPKAAGAVDDMAAALRSAGAPVLDAPKPHAALTERVVIRGRASGGWFAEAEFPVKLLAGDGHELAAATATAEGSWMTEGYVPFRAELQLQGPIPARAMLVLARANPSGLERNAGFLLVRVGCG
jgi:hypothetical protein